MTRYGSPNMVGSNSLSRRLVNLKLQRALLKRSPRNWKVAFPKIRICIPLGLWKINLLGWYFVFHWDQGKTDWVLMLKYLKLLCRFREYLERDFCIKKSAQETNICMASFGQCLFMRYIFSLKVEHRLMLTSLHF